MKTNDIIDLQETSQNHWRAKYQGNYGVYTIKVAFDKNGHTSNFSCSCPSDYYPCKHIPMVKEAIAKRIAESERPSANAKGKKLTVEELLAEVSLEELRSFVVRQAKHNADVSNAINLAFAHKQPSGGANPYSAIIRDMLEQVHFDVEDYYDEEEYFDLDGLDQWLEKAQEYVEQGNPREAVLICKACIEEFAEWLQGEDEESENYLDSDYQVTPFEIIEKAAAESPDVDAKELYGYCVQEVGKSKYAETEMFDGFNNLLSTLAMQANPDEFIALQDSLLKKIANKGSYEAEKILQRKIDFYSKNRQPEKAAEVLEKNLQVENFRYKVAEKRFAELNFTEAKRLVTEYLSGKKSSEHYDTQRWQELLLKIAQKEGDIPSIQAIAFLFIDKNFDKKYFDIYKSTFPPDEWSDALERLIEHYKASRSSYSIYAQPSGFNSNVAEVLAAEVAAERLMQYVEQYPSATIVEEYHKAFAAQYPEKTLDIFRKAVDCYAEKNLGREHYEYIVRLLKQMRRIKNGDKTVAEMISRYRVEYKNRRAMMEILNKSQNEGKK
ncbi:MAG: SWIM zinc finger family protein [Prevotellaceae bacterium]|jgi:hypothetical protein|nr:SWIM zinc finger family protein [Prevotellaceae bacterium]